MPTKEKIALFDMDGTLAEYEGKLLADLNQLAAPSEPELLSLDNLPQHVEHRAKLIKSQPGWWRALDPIPLGLHVLTIAHNIGFKIHILTKGPFRTTLAWEEKVLWCRQHVDSRIGQHADITITEDKGLVYGTVLVDDFPDYINRWLTWRPRGVVLFPPRPCNAGFFHPQAVPIVTADTMYPILKKAFDA